MSRQKVKMCSGIPVFEFDSEMLGERYFYAKHPSGLSIYVFPKALSSTSALYATKFGSADAAFRFSSESEEIAVPDGTAHFLEHKMFEEEDGSDAFEQFAPFGADVNAFTSWDKTAYLFHTTSDEKECLSRLISFVSNPYFTDASVKKEQGIIAEEIRMNDDTPSERCFVNMLSALYRENSVRKEICGSEASISTITPQVLYDCYRVFYCPSNMTLVVCGRMSMEEVLSTVTPLLPETSDDRPVLRRDENENEPDAVRVPRVEAEMSVGKPIFMIGIKDMAGVRLSAEERMRRDVLMSLLKEICFATSTDLYTKLLDEGKISPNFSAGYGATPLYAFFEIAGESDDPDYVLSEVKRTLREVAQRGVSEEEFERARRVLYAKSVKSFDSTRSISEMLLDYVLLDYELFRYVSLYTEVTADEVTALLREAFCDEYFTLSVVSPLGESEEAEETIETEDHF